MLVVIHFLFLDSRMGLRRSVKISKQDEQGILFFMEMLDRFLFDLVVNVEDRVANFLSASFHVCIRKHNFLRRVDCIFEFLCCLQSLSSSLSSREPFTLSLFLFMAAVHNSVRESDANVCTRIGSLQLVLKRVCLVGDTFTHEHDVGA